MLNLKNNQSKNENNGLDSLDYQIKDSKGLSLEFEKESSSELSLEAMEEVQGGTSGPCVVTVIITLLTSHPAE